MANKLSWVWVGLGVLALAGGLVIQSRYARDIETAHVHFAEEHHDEALNDVSKISDGIRAIQQNLSLLAALPSVRDTDRHGENLSQEAQVTIQQIYKNLFTDAALSEIYLIPIDFDPSRTDPATGKKEVPIMSFDALIVDPARKAMKTADALQTLGLSHSSTPKIPEVEDYEYAELVAQASWFKAHAPRRAPDGHEETPLISSPEVITCDNTQYINTAKEADRSGVIFSVPFYDQGNQLKGMISGIILSNNLKRMMPSPNNALVNPGYSYVVMNKGAEALTSSTEAIRAGLPDQALAHSETFPLAQKEGRSPWWIWVGTSQQEFEQSKDVLNARDERRNSTLALLFCIVAAAGYAVMARRQIRQNADLAESHLMSRNLAESAKAEADRSAAKLSALNDDISKLNNQLAENLKQLSNAQEHAISSGKMAQLGQLIATVAHEIRNPLAGIRTTMFTLKRRCTEAGIAADAQFARIETGINRCDGIISQLLDFSRAQAIQADALEMVSWLRTIITEFAEDTAPQVTFKLILGEDALTVPFDAERLRRALFNLLSNARDSVLAKNNGGRRIPVIEVELQRTARGAEVEIRDNGQGIAPEALAKIGEPFFTSKSFGSGLGVAAAKQVATLHGGGLEFSSESGQGAHFRIWLPLAPEARVNAA